MGKRTLRSESLLCPTTKWGIECPIGKRDVGSSKRRAGNQGSDQPHPSKAKGIP